MLVGPEGAQDPLGDSFCAECWLHLEHLSTPGATRGSQRELLGKKMGFKVRKTTALGPLGPVWGGGPPPYPGRATPAPAPP